MLTYIDIMYWLLAIGLILKWVLYHDCSDLRHVLVFTITWQEKKAGDIMV